MIMKDELNLVLALSLDTESHVDSDLKEDCSTTGRGVELLLVVVRGFSSLVEAEISTSALSETVIRSPAVINGSRETDAVRSNRSFFDRRELNVPFLVDIELIFFVSDDRELG